jgi:hypothetical protein
MPRMRAAGRAAVRVQRILLEGPSVVSAVLFNHFMGKTRSAGNLPGWVCHRRIRPCHQAHTAPVRVIQPWLNGYYRAWVRRSSALALPEPRAFVHSSPDRDQRVASLPAFVGFSMVGCPRAESSQARLSPDSGRRARANQDFPVDSVASSYRPGPSGA